MNSILNIIVKNIYWYLYGKTISNPNLPQQVQSILFICKGNICRSPFAEHISAKKYNSDNRYLFCSAGIHVVNPISSPDNAIISAKYIGVDLQDHKSRQIKYSLMESNDVIVAMETWQYNYLKKMFPEFRKKIFLLPLFENNISKDLRYYYLYNIKDPYGKNIQEYNECYAKIESCIAILFYEINKNNLNKGKL